MKTLHSWFARPMRRAQRRTLVIATALLVIAWLAPIFIVADIGDRLEAVLLATIALWSVMVLRLGLSTRRLTERSSASLDEREIELRNRVYFRSYQAVMAIGLLLLFVTMAVWSFDLTFTGVGEPGRIVALTLVAYVMLVLNLPWALLAWQLPDPLEEDTLHLQT